MMKLKEIILDKNEALLKIEGFINDLNLSKSIQSDGDLFYNENDLYIEDIVTPGNIEDIKYIKNTIIYFIRKYWENFIDQIPIQKFDDGFAIIISKDSNNKWFFQLETYKKGKSHLYISFSEDFIKKIS